MHSVSALFGGAAGGITLYYVDLAEFRLIGRAVCQFARQFGVFQPGFASCVIPCFSGGFPCAGCVQRFIQYGFCRLRVFLKIGHQFFINHGGNKPRDIRVAEFAFGLALKLCFRQFYADYRGQTLAHIVAGKFFIAVFQDIKFFAVVVKYAGQRGFESRFVGTAVYGIDIIGKGKQNLVIGIRITERNFGASVLFRCRDMDHFILNGIKPSCFVYIFNKGFDTALIVINLFFLFFGITASKV